jgi:hypothetical protein
MTSKLLKDNGFRPFTDFDGAAADGRGSIEFNTVDAGLVTFDETGVVIALHKDSGDQAILEFGVVDGRVALTDSGIKDSLDHELDEIEAMLAELFRGI